MAGGEGGRGALTPYDPGADAADRYPDWVIRHCALRGVAELMCPERRVILLEYDASAAARRGSLAHAVAHIDLGHLATSGVLSARQEVAADKMAARRLIHLHLLAAAWSWAETDEEVADELDVEPHYVEVRMRYLLAAERRFLRHHVSLKVRTA